MSKDDAAERLFAAADAIAQARSLLEVFGVATERLCTYLDTAENEVRDLVPERE
jgi:uncharacterized protein YggE